ncbi:hypothetical protein SGFS_095680 [Streptomyces graminofaciens]|uniref:non-specific serine/threonine protein kinase n=1 Tax=Streptomyces graminofaciens TaxID=68212 RepID=A0ABN5VXW3_9ACTN|nr:serine/threonine-protein kinase [Streptomyces graminofaciens]BBC38274.1 hypothetical protein SGFS_095680 [Streptomyces graminofaciens]
MASGAPQSEPGRVVAGRYLLLNKLGSGGMGHVWLAHDQELSCEVALKEVVFRTPGEEARDRSDRIARAYKEARYAAWLRSHPHVVTVLDVLEYDGLPWIVMEYVPGAVDLRALVARRGALAPAECARIGLAMLDALNAGHARGVMHRDVKPANILLAPDHTGSPYARVMLTDYGISVQPDGEETRLTGTSMLVGTAAYLAPERVKGKDPTPATDLFSLGCTLYHGVEGYGPFDRPSEYEVLTAILEDPPRPMLRAGALESVLKGMLEKDPVRRLSTVEAQAALSAVLTPQSYPRTQLDQGSQPQWASGPTQTVAPESGGGLRSIVQEPTAPPFGQDVPLASPLPVQEPPLFRPPERGPVPPATGTGGFDAPSVVQRPGSDKRSRVGRVVLAGLLGLLLAGVGVLYAVGYLPLTGGIGGDKDRPYGDLVGLNQPLHEGDCVSATWPDTPFTGVPALQRVQCVGSLTEGQVMAVYKPGSAEEAASDGFTQCEERTKEIRDRLADVRSYAILPTEKGFETAGERVACLVMGAHRPLYGPLGEYRKPGLRFTETANMQKQDCLQTISDNTAKLVSCEGPYNEKVLGFTRLDPQLTYGKAEKKAEDACVKNVRPEDYGYDPSRVTTGYWISGSAWKRSSHFVVCTVAAQNGDTMEGDEV